MFIHQTKNEKNDLRGLRVARFRGAWRNALTGERIEGCTVTVPPETALVLAEL
jgi:hypothetical protein